MADRQLIHGANLLATLEGGIVVFALATGLVLTHRNEMPEGLQSFLSMRISLRNALLLAALIIGWKLTFRMFRLYTVGGARNAATERERVCLACGTGSLLALAMSRLTVGGGIGPVGVLYFFTLSCGITLLERQGRRALSRRREHRRVLIIGSGARALALWGRLAADESIHYELAGFLDTPDGLPANDHMAQQRLGTLDDLEPLLMRHAVDEVFVALPVKSHYADIREAILVCERVGVRAKYEAHLFDSQVAWPGYEDPSAPTVTMHVVPSDYRMGVKRALDIVGASVALVMCSPVMLAAAVAIKATSPGPIIFAQERYGLNRRRFRMFKFRTMRLDAEQLQAALEAQNEADGPVFKIFDDPRVTRLGKWLRRTSVDELPQLLNVLRGEMSLVGPRPLPLRDVTRFTCPSDMRRFSVRPGLTCLWQISGRSTLSFSDWIRLDLDYIDGWSLALDALILVRTLPAVISGNGAR